jgi:hypothetical protein
VEPSCSSHSALCILSAGEASLKSALVLSGAYNRAPEQSQQLETLTYQSGDSDGRYASARSGASSHNAGADASFSLALTGDAGADGGGGGGIKTDLPDTAVSVSCEHSNVPSGCIEFLDKLSKYLLFK